MDPPILILLAGVALTVSLGFARFTRATGTSASPCRCCSRSGFSHRQCCIHSRRAGGMAIDLHVEPDGGDHRWFPIRRARGRTPDLAALGSALAVVTVGLPSPISGSNTWTPRWPIWCEAHVIDVRCDRVSKQCAACSRTGCVLGLRDLSFDVVRGGSTWRDRAERRGKSTLLKLLAGITTPTEGRIEIRGRLSRRNRGIRFSPGALGPRERVSQRRDPQAYAAGKSPPSSTRLSPSPAWHRSSTCR